MKSTFAIVPSLLLLAHVSLAQENSALFSQYLGAPTVSATFGGDSATLQSSFFTICTNYVHGLAAIPTVLATSLAPQLQQQQVDGVCQFCTSLSQSRPDSCCAVPTSVACFEAFASGGAAKTNAPATPASTTPAGTAATGAPTAAATSKSGGERIETAGFIGNIVAVLGFVGWVL